MVLCKFYQQGSCRFGSKCHNEHFDAKQVLKTDVESAVNGKQWPLSSYGPFKDKPSIPNFIEDKSFEEIRLLCYEARQKNFFDQFHQQFTKEALEASNKMKALLQMTPEILDVVIQCYDAPGPDSGAVVKQSNAFGMGTTNTVATSVGSIFAKPTTTTAASSIFGGGNQGGFGGPPSSGAGIFGGAVNSQGSNAFGGSSAFSQTQQQQGSIFGQVAKPANSIFGGSTGNQQQATSIFGHQQQQQQQPAVMGGNLFAQPVPSQPPPGSFGLFSQQQPPQQQQQASMFSQQPQQNTGNIFGQSAVPQQNMQQQVGTAGQGLFAQAAQQTQNFFGQSMQQQQPQQMQQAQMQQAPTNVFQQAQQIPNQQPVQEQLPPPPTGIFKQAALQTLNPPAYNTTIAPSSLYSRMEDLTPEEIESFKADCFQPGKLPHNPPPRELLN